MTVDGRMAEGGFEDDEVEVALPDGPLNEAEEREGGAFLSKIGGRPFWLGARGGGLREGLACDLCRAPLYLVLQLDSPLPARRGDAFEVDRVIYVFACNSRTCTESASAPSRAVKAIVQSQRRPAEERAPPAAAPPSFWETLMATPSQVEGLTDTLSAVSLGPKGEAAGCEAGTGQQACYDGEYPVGFAGVALHIVEELIAPHKISPSADGYEREARLGHAEGLDGGEAAFASEAYEKMHIPGYDKAFRTFHSRTSHYPRQCARYAPRGRPLPFSGDLAGAHEIPACAACGGRQAFQLQVMPAILSLLRTNDPAHLAHIPEHVRGSHPLFGDGMEWGSIFVYACEACTTAARGAAAEDLAPRTFSAFVAVQCEQ